MKFTVFYSDRPKCIDIESEANNNSHSEAFLYSNIYKCYTNGNGHGLQSNKLENYKSLMKMCDKISQAVYDYQKEIQNEKT